MEVQGKRFNKIVENLNEIHLEAPNGPEIWAYTPTKVAPMSL